MELLRSIFIPFYLYRKMVRRFKSSEERFDWRGNKADKLPFEYWSFYYGLILSTYMLARFTLGMKLANDPSQCRIQSVGDVIITPMYALGCNVGKDRFDIKIN